MIRSFLTLTLRNLLNHKFSTFVNIIGLALGFAGLISIGLYVYDENQYDKFHTKGDRIFRAQSNCFNVERVMTNLPARLYDPIMESIPEVEHLVRIMPRSMDVLVEIGEQSFLEKQVFFADPAFFEVFSFELQEGNLENWRQNEYSVLISSELASKYFGDENAVGKNIRIEGRFEFEVAGVLKAIPKHSHLQFDLLFNFGSLQTVHPHALTSWGNFSSDFYFLLREGVVPEGIQDKILETFSNAIGIDYKERGVSLQLVNLKDIYLNSTQVESFTNAPAGNKQSIRIFSFAALLILVLACFNFVNLATARSTQRAREVGIRKLLGADRRQLARLFLAESFLVCFLGLIVGFGILEITLPYFSHLSGKPLALSIVPPVILISGLLGVFFLVAILAGSYPALVLAGFQPVQVLKGTSAIINQQLKGRLGVSLRLRQLFIVLQFAISIGLVASSLVFSRQTSYALSNAGFDRNYLVVMDNLPGPVMNDLYHALKNELEQYPEVVSVSAGAHVPSEPIGNQGRLLEAGLSSEYSKPIVFAPVDFGYFETLGAQMAQGRTFDRNEFSDSTQAVILNEAAVRLLELEEPLGTILAGFWDTPNKKVIGVVKDVHFQSMHKPVQATAFFPAYRFQGYSPATTKLIIRFNSNNFSSSVNLLNQVWEKHVSGYPPRFFFMDSRYESLYRKELQVNKVTGVFTFMAILIACLGLLGTTAYVIESRKKEFGIRKVLGASAGRIIRMISVEFSLLIFLSFIIAWPVSWYFLEHWLGNFVNRIDLSPWYFLASALGGWLLAMLTINLLALNQARQNPIDALKYE